MSITNASSFRFHVVHVRKTRRTDCKKADFTRPAIDEALKLTKVLSSVKVFDVEIII